MIEKIKKIILISFDVCLFPFSLLYLPLLKLIRKYNVRNFWLHKKMFLRMGVFPIRDHYYDPQFRFSDYFDASKARLLVIDFALRKQIESLRKLSYTDELTALPLQGDPKGSTFYVNNPSFGPGDCDIYYLIVRNYKPRKIIEIGSGFSTLICYEAIKRNNQEGFSTELFCIEPYEMPWLSQMKGIHLIRKEVEKVSLDTFQVLEENDILFIDSSHIIRPENDVLFEFLELLPRLKKGVIIHVHDIFTPRHYPVEWLKEEFRFWNEQYLLEAFLCFNDQFEIMYTLNHLKHEALPEIREVLKNLNQKDEPASFWFKKIK